MYTCRGTPIYRGTPKISANPDTDGPTKDPKRLRNNFEKIREGQQDEVSKIRDYFLKTTGTSSFEK